MELTSSTSEEQKLVEAVLLADGWHEVWDRSFEITADDTAWRNTNDVVIQPGDVCFRFFIDGDHEIQGPLSSVLAVRIGP